MDYINKTCRKEVLFFHAAYMAAFTGCYLGVDGTYRARMAPVNHNATNDFTVIAEITWNYSGSDIPRLKGHHKQHNRQPKWMILFVFVVLLVFIILLCNKLK